MNVPRFFTISVAFYGKFANFGTIFKFGNNFSKNPSLFRKTPKFENFWEVLQIQSLSQGSLLHSAVYITFILFLNKTISFFKKTQLLKVLRNFTNLVAFTRLIATFRVFKKIKNLFEKTNFFFSKKSTYERFENFYYFVAFHDNFATFTNF